MKGRRNLFLILLIIGIVNIQNFDIEDFIEYLDSIGLRGIIQEIFNISEDESITIEFCQKIINHFQEFCESYVRTYLIVEKENAISHSVNQHNDISVGNINAGPTIREKDIKNQEKMLRQILFDPNVKSNFIKNMTDREKNILISKIIKRNIK